jgi:hypothetical protein
MSYEDRAFDALDTMITESEYSVGVLDVSSYTAEDRLYDLVERMEEDDIVTAVDGDRYLVTDEGRQYHAEQLQEDVIDALAGDEPLSAAGIASALGYKGCDSHASMFHDCGINAVRRSLRPLLGSHVGPSSGFKYRLSSSERKKRP